MKCLEKLSLVDDECMKDLQKDIEELINSYINIEKQCVEIFKEIKNSLDVWEIRKICNILYKTDVFWGGEPVLINSSGWEHYIIEFFNFDNKKDTAKSLKELINAMEVFSHNKDNWIDIENENYWMFREGADGELLFYKQEELLDFIEKQIKWEELETQIELYKLFKRYQKKYKKFNYLKRR